MRDSRGEFRNFALVSETVKLIITAAGGAAAKQLVESAYKSGTAWLSSFFKDHQPKAIEKAERNSGEFLNRLSLKVDQLEQDHRVDRAIIDRALEEPSFGALLQSALIGSAQTENGDKHDLLASIVASRLTADNESVLAVASQMAASAVAHCSPNQLHFLGYCASTTLRWHRLDNAKFQTKEEMLKECIPWFEIRFAPYRFLEIRHVDLFHLEAVSCLSAGNVGHALESMLSANWTAGAFKITGEDIMRLTVGECMVRLWNQGAINAHLTSVGTLIGILVSDKLCGADHTVFSEDWTT
jgi:hypothetical protein